MDGGCLLDYHWSKSFPYTSTHPVPHLTSLKPHMAGGSIQNPAPREPVLQSCTPIGLQCSHTLVTFARSPTLVKCIPSLPADPNYWYSTPLLNRSWWLYHTDPMGQHQSVLCSLQQGRENVLTDSTTEVSEVKKHRQAHPPARIGRGVRDRLQQERGLHGIPTQPQGSHHGPHTHK